MSRELAIGFDLTSDWMTKSRDFFYANRFTVLILGVLANPKQMQSIFDNYVKSAVKK